MCRFEACSQVRNGVESPCRDTRFSVAGIGTGSKVRSRCENVRMAPTLTTSVIKQLPALCSANIHVLRFSPSGMILQYANYTNQEGTKAHGIS